MQTATIKFSIIVPTYNRSAALDRCLNSLRAQTFKSFEVLVCDDGSKDETNLIVEKFQDILNLKYFYEENWGGPAKPRNTGIKFAKGEYICFLDSDDWWKPNKLEILNEHLSNHFNVYYHTLMITNSVSEFREINCRQINNKSPKNDLLVNLNTLPTSSVCIKAEFLKKSGGFSLDKSIIGLEDYKLWIDLGGMGGSFKQIDFCLGYYFTGDLDSITFEDERQIKRFEKLYEFYFNEATPKLRNQINGSLYFHKGRIIQDAKLPMSYLPYLFKAFLNGSFRVKLMALKRILGF